MFEKNALRKKAMEAMMKDGPAIPMKKAEPEMEIAEGGEKEGYEAVMLSPEEKAMVMAMRQKGEAVDEMPAEEESYEA